MQQHGEPLIIDEVQYAPKLFRYLKHNVDQNRDRNGRYLLTGSQKFSLMAQVSDSLAGSIGIIECLPLSLLELENHFQTRAEGEQLLLWLLKGGYPEIYRSDLSPLTYYSDYVATYLERDVRQLIQVKDLREFERFLRLLALMSGQLLSYTSMASDVGVSPNTIKSWLAVLAASQVVHLLEPYYRNTTNSLKKSPKVYFMDTGLCCFLLGISTPEQLLQYPKLGALFETLVFGQIYRQAALNDHSEHLYFYRDAMGREVDFVIESAGRFRLVEVKWSAEPQRVSAGFDAFTKLVGADAISERRFVTRERTMIAYPGANVGDPVNW